MSSSCIGRGRGWLNLKKTPVVGVTEPPPPDNSPGTIQLNSQSVKLNMPQSDDTQLADISKKYSDLINIIKQMDGNDDGIKFNQKIKYIIEKWQENCQNGEEVEHSFDIIHKTCLSDTELASKLVTMISSRTFISQEVHEKNIRLMFVRKLQNDFEGSKVLQKTNPVAFRNVVHMLGEFYSKARLANGQHFSFMITPLTSCLDMLLESAERNDLELFVTLLCLTGRSIEKECPEKISDITNNARLLLASEKQLTKECKLFLLLAMDVANNRYGLPARLLKFYQEHLGNSTLGKFCEEQGNLSIDIVQNKDVNGLQGGVNLLQLSSSDYTSDGNSSTYSTRSDTNVSSQTSSATNFMADCNSKANAKDTTGSSGKHGRPILGVGARLTKTRTTDESNSNWKGNNRSGSWNKQKNADNWDTSESTNVNKGKGYR